MKVLKNIGDISKYNAISNYSLLKDHFDGVIVRIGYRGYAAGTIKEDTLFRKHMAGLENARDSLWILLYVTGGDGIGSDC